MNYDKSVVVPLPPDETFALITQPERLRRWQSMAARIDLRAGGDYRWTVVPGMSAMGTVTEVEPGRRLVLGWGWEHNTIVPPDDSTVTITLEPTADGTVVRLVHEGLSDEQARAHGQGWDHYLDRLALAGATGDAGLDTYHYALDDLDELKAAEATLAVVEHVLRQVSPEASDVPTPSCPMFTVRELVAHLAGSIVSLGQIAGADLAAAGETAAANRSLPLEVWIADLAQPALEAWRQRGLEGDIDAGGMAMPAGFFAGILSVEFFVHAWDIAQATGQKLEVPDVLVAYVLTLTQRVIGDDMRRPEMFGPPLAVGEDAGALDQLIAFTGRAAA